MKVFPLNGVSAQAAFLIKSDFTACGSCNISFCEIYQNDVCFSLSVCHQDGFYVFLVEYWLKKKKILHHHPNKTHDLELK